MKCMKFSIQLLSKPNDVFAELINFKNMPKLLPRQLKKMEIISEKENQIKYGKNIKLERNFKKI
jgi:hypothetical protein